MVYTIKTQKKNSYHSQLTTQIHDFGTNLLQVINDSKIYNISRKMQNITKQHEVAYIPPPLPVISAKVKES